VLDFVYQSHRRTDHYWAQQAQSGSEEFSIIYFILSDRRWPISTKKPCVEISPPSDAAAYLGTRRMPAIGVWTTFQFRFPVGFEITGTRSSFARCWLRLLFIANTGVDFVRLDAVRVHLETKWARCAELPRPTKNHPSVNAFSGMRRRVWFSKAEADRGNPR